MQAPSNPSQPNVASACYTMVQATTTTWTIVDLGQPKGDVYNCDAANVVPLHGNYGKGVTLADVGKSMSDLK